MCCLENKPKLWAVFHTIPINSCIVIAGSQIPINNRSPPLFIIYTKTGENLHDGQLGRGWETVCASPQGPYIPVGFPLLSKLHSFSAKVWSEDHIFRRKTQWYLSSQTLETESLDSIIRGAHIQYVCGWLQVIEPSIY